MSKLTQLTLVVVLLLLIGTIALADTSVPAGGGPVGGVDSLSKAAVLKKVLDSDRKFYKKAKGSINYPDPIMQLKPIVSAATMITAAYKKARALRIKELAKSVLAVEDKNHKKKTTYYRYRMTPKRRAVIAEAALRAEERTGVDATFLVALARMESDFRGLILINTACKYRRAKRCYADCGMTQHHVRGSRKYVYSYCKKLSKNHALSFYKSAQEIARHVTWCTTAKHAKYHRPLRRCVLNRYNQGPFYKTSKKCKRWYRCQAIYNRADMSMEMKNKAYARCRPKHRKCRGRAAYWKMVTCFEYGARRKIRSKRNCRYCYSIPKIKSSYYKDLTKPVPPKTTVIQVSSNPASPKSSNKTTN